MQQQSESRYDPGSTEPSPVHGAFRWRGGWRSWLPISLWMLALIGMCLYFNCIGILFFGQHSPVDRVVTQSDRVLVLRLPPRSHGYQEQIIVGEDGSASRGDLDMIGASVRYDDFEIAQLSAEQLADINHLRHDWCANSPSFPVTTDTQLCEVGLRCGDVQSLTWTTRRIQVPCTQLPAELAALMQTIPSPKPE
jgi:hypothetical protein